jgi:hypothetical protein
MKLAVEFFGQYLRLLPRFVPRLPGEAGPGASGRNTRKPADPPGQARYPVQHFPECSPRAHANAGLDSENAGNARLC